MTTINGHVSRIFVFDGKRRCRVNLVVVKTARPLSNCTAQFMHYVNSNCSMCPVVEISTTILNLYALILHRMTLGQHSVISEFSLCKHVIYPMLGTRSVSLDIGTTKSNQHPC